MIFLLFFLTHFILYIWIHCSLMASSIDNGNIFIYRFLAIAVLFFICFKCQQNLANLYQLLETFDEQSSHFKKLTLLISFHNKNFLLYFFTCSYVVIGSSVNIYESISLVAKEFFFFTLFLNFMKSYFYSIDKGENHVATITPDLIIGEVIEPNFRYFGVLV